MLYVSRFFKGNGGENNLIALFLQGFPKVGREQAVRTRRAGEKRKESRRGEQRKGPREPMGGKAEGNRALGPDRKSWK